MLLVNLKSGNYSENPKFKAKVSKSLFIDEFKEDVKFINGEKDRVMVLHIENLTKPLYLVFPKRLNYILLISSLIYETG